MTTRFLSFMVLAIAALTAGASRAEASTIILTDLSLGYYNSSIGTTLNGSAGFPASGDPNVPPIAPAPDLTAASGILGAWLSASPVLNANWTGLQAIPNGWTPGTETAIVIPFLVTSMETLIGSFGVDNGLYVWLDGVYKFGAMAPGGVGVYEYPNFSLGTVAVGQHFLQIMREDHGGATGWAMQIQADPVPEPGTMMLVGTGAAGLIARLRRRRVE